MLGEFMKSDAATIIGGIGLAIWVGVPIVAILWPQRQHDPQRGMAVGLLMIVSLIGVVLSLIYAAGLAFGVRWMVAIPVALNLGWMALVAVCGVRGVVHKLSASTR